MNTEAIVPTNHKGIFLGAGSYWKACYRGRNAAREIVALVEVFTAGAGEFYSIPETSRIIEIAQ